MKYRVQYEAEFLSTKILFGEIIVDAINTYDVKYQFWGNIKKLINHDYDEVRDGFVHAIRITGVKEIEAA